MNVSFALSVAVLLVGLALYLLPTSTKPQEIGFAAGLLVTLLRFAGEAFFRIG